MQEQGPVGKEINTIHLSMFKSRTGSWAASSSLAGQEGRGQGLPLSEFRRQRLGKLPAISLQ